MLDGQALAVILVRSFWVRPYPHGAPCRMLSCLLRLAEASSGSGVSAEAVVLVIVLVLLAAVLGAVYVVHACWGARLHMLSICLCCRGYTYVKLRRLKVDPDSYKGLSGKFNELGTLAG